MPIRPFKEVPKNAVEWARYLNTTDVTPTEDSVGNGEIQDGAVTYAKLQDVNPNKLLGRDTSPAGTVQELDVGGGLEFTGSGIQRSALTGDIVAVAGATTTTFRQGSANSILGRSANTAGVIADIVAASDSQFLRRASGSVGFGAITDADIPSGIARDAEVASAISDAISALYTAGSFTASLTGCTTVPTGTIYYVMVGDSVILSSDTLTGTSNTTAATLTGMPAAIYPTRTQAAVIRVRENGTSVFGLAEISTSGVITLYPDAFGSGFTAANAKGILRSSFSYLRS